MYRLHAEAAHNAGTFTERSTTHSVGSQWSSKMNRKNSEKTTVEAFADTQISAQQVEALERCLSQPNFAKAMKPRKQFLKKEQTTVAEVLREHSLYIKRQKCLFNHHGRFIRNWDIVAMSGLIYTAIVTPVEVSFLEEKVWSALFVLNQIITVIFILDMIIQFFLPFDTEGVVGITTVTNHWKIAKHYLRGWFFLDLCSVLPLDTIGSVTGSESMKRMKVVRFLRLLRLLKMIRLLRASRIFARWQTILAISYTTQSLWKFGLMLTMGAHWISCLWGLVGHELEAYTWVDALEENKPNGMPLREPFNLYLASLHFAVMTITSIGFGDIVPQQRLEYILAICIQCVGGMLWAYSMGEVMVVLSNLNPANTLFKQRMDELNRMMKERKLPTDIRRRLRSFFLQSKEMRQAERYTSLLVQMSPQLQGEVARTTNMRWISKVWYLRPSESIGSGGISDYLIARIAVGLKVRVYAQSEAVRSDDALNVLTRGLASCQGRLLRAGEIWGDDFILEHRPLRRMNIVLALTFIEVQELQRHMFQDIIDHHASKSDYNVVRKAVVKFAFIRGVVLHARRVVALRKLEEAGLEYEKLNTEDNHKASMDPSSPEFPKESPNLRENARCPSESSMCSCCSGAGAPKEMTDTFKKEMRAIIRSEMRAVMESHMEHLANTNTRQGHSHHQREDPRALPSHRFGDEIATFLRMPSIPMPPLTPGVSLPGQPD